MNNITIEQLEHLLKEMCRLQLEHPRANVLYDVERARIEITYPLPKDFVKYVGSSWKGRSE